MLDKYFNENHAKKGEAEQILEIWFKFEIYAKNK